MKFFSFGPSAEEQEIERARTIRSRAEKAINAKYIDKKLFVVVNELPILRVTNESDIVNGTISLSDLDSFVESLRQSYEIIHHDDKQ